MHVEKNIQQSPLCSLFTTCRRLLLIIWTIHRAVMMFSISLHWIQDHFCIYSFINAFLIKWWNDSVSSMTRFAKVEHVLFNLLKSFHSLYCTVNINCQIKFWDTRVQVDPLNCCSEVAIQTFEWPSVQGATFKMHCYLPTKFIHCAPLEEDKDLTLQTFIQLFISALVLG